jgi:hypothetical protein
MITTLPNSAAFRPRNDSFLSVNRASAELTLDRLNNVFSVEPCHFFQVEENCLVPD